MGRFSARYSLDQTLENCMDARSGFRWGSSLDFSPERPFRNIRDTNRNRTESLIRDNVSNPLKTAPQITTLRDCTKSSHKTTEASRSLEIRDVTARSSVTYDREMKELL